MEGLLTQIFKRNLYILRAIRLYPSSGDKLLHRVFAYVIYIAIMFPQFVLTLVKLSKTGVISNEKYLVTIGTTFLTVKYFCFLISSDDLKTCIEYFDHKFMRGENATQQRIIRMSITLSRNICSVCFVGMYVSMFGWIATLNFENYCYDFPLDIGSFATCDSQPVLYVCVYVLCIVAGIYCVVACSGVDSLVPGLLYVAIGQLRILKEALENLPIDVDGEKGFRNTTQSTKMYKSIVKCILHYSDIVKFVRQCEKIFSSVMFTQFSESILAIGLACLQIIKAEKVDLDLAVSLMYIVVLLFQVYFYCYFGTLLEEENGTLSDAIYMGRWYEYSLESKKSILILMECSKKPLVVTAGKIVELSLETFTTILRRSYSVICILKN